jgi:hypothetical protein
MRQYEGTVAEDVMLATWWGRLMADGELATTFLAPHRPLAGFFQFFRSPTVLLYEMDEGQLEFAAWLLPFMDAWLFGFYITPPLRGTKRMLRWIEEAIGLALQSRPSIVGLTRRPERVQLYVRFGCRLAAKLAQLAEGEDTYLVQLTRTAFEARMKRRQPSDLARVLEEATR